MLVKRNSRIFRGVDWRDRLKRFGMGSYLRAQGYQRKGVRDLTKFLSTTNYDKEHVLLELGQ